MATNSVNGSGVSIKFSDTDNSPCGVQNRVDAEKSFQSMVVKPLLQKAMSRCGEQVQKKQKALKGEDT